MTFLIVSEAKSCGIVGYILTYKVTQSLKESTVTAFSNLVMITYVMHAKETTDSYHMHQ